jgi:hypothetical protein
LIKLGKPSSHLSRSRIFFLFKKKEEKEKKKEKKKKLTIRKRPHLKSRSTYPQTRQTKRNRKTTSWREFDVVCG